MAGFLVQGKRVAIAPAVLASIYYGLGAVAQEKVGPGQCNAEFPLYMRLPLLDLGKLKDYVPEMLAIENIEAGKFDAKIARLFICHPMSFTWRPYKHEPKTKAKEAPADPKDKEKGKAAEQPVESISSDKEMISALRHGMRGN
ncbi:hypothetical protein CJ030_MR1G013843 [Morella rubra]|uniref:Uncharacterized protein n=1 Tax=Morella rubra TaxID=262757 RepID=A0A6A1WTF8_9ROSI|nr:hypothetical protein CJ030_MR1G013843 [Morella rubra]